MQYIFNFFRLFLILVSILLFIGRDHFILGTGFILLKWLLIPLLFLSFIRSKKKELSKIIQHTLFITFILLFSEFLFVQVTKERSSCNDCNNSIKVLSYNVFFKNRSPKTIIKLIKEEQPDVIALQELTPSINRLLNNNLSHKYPYTFSFPLKGTHGLAVYSKFPINKQKLLRNKSNAPFAQAMEISTHSKKINLINVHLSSPAIAVENPDRFLPLFHKNYQQRERQYQKIVNYMEARPYPTSIMLGDFNTTPVEPLMRSILSSWDDTHSLFKSGTSFTFPNQVKAPLFVRLDYILMRGEITAKTHLVKRTGSSDHLPVISTLLFN